MVLKYKNILKDIEEGKITAQEGLDKLYPKEKVKYGKRASFIKLKIHVLKKVEELILF